MLTDGAAVELAGFSSCYWSLLFFFQVTTYACILAEPFQGRAIFSIDNLDMHNKSGFGFNSGQQICRTVKICFGLQLSEKVCVCLCVCACAGVCVCVC